MKNAWIAVAATLLAMPAARAEIFRCVMPGGTISYQELPCTGESSGGRTGLPTAFPEVDATARERLFQREAALDRRLEAERERLSREAMNRVSAQAQVEAAQAAARARAAEPVYVIGWPRAAPRHVPRHVTSRTPPPMFLR